LERRLSVRAGVFVIAGKACQHCLRTQPRKVHATLAAPPGFSVWWMVRTTGTAPLGRCAYLSPNVLVQHYVSNHKDALVAHSCSIC